MPDAHAALATIASWPQVRAESDRAREACTQLRWHTALRRRIPEAAAESRIRGAWASAELEGARSAVDIVRARMVGAQPAPVTPDPAEHIVAGAMAVTAATETLTRLIRTAPRQTIAQLHTTAAKGLVQAEHLGRPRPGGVGSPEFAILGPAPAAGEAAARLAALDVVLADPDLPALVVAAIAHAEVAHARPFARGNGLVARAIERIVVQASGLDPTGVAVPEAGHHRRGMAAYHGALAAYGLGTQQGVTVWIGHCADALVAAAQEGTEIADAVLAGRLH